MSQRIERDALSHILQAESVETLSLSQLIRLFREDDSLADFLPAGDWQVDPRNGDRVLFHPSRAQRPHDYLQSPSSAPAGMPACAVCQGRTTGVIDVADLSEGFTFINKNLYPILFPLREGEEAQGRGTLPVRAHGLHFLQWTSSLHDRDWHNMPLADRVVVMQRLAALEGALLKDSGGLSPTSEPGGKQSGRRGFVLIIKNFGRLVGGSLAHGHQQIAWSNILPGRLLDDRRFEADRGEVFAAFLMRENPPELLVRDYGPAVLLVPYFMRRPYAMMLLVKDVSKRHVYELTGAEIAAVAEGWHDAIRALRWIMPRVGREIAFNVVTHNGPGAGLYFEFLPYTQETGGFEHLGLWICHGDPEPAAVRIRTCLE